MILALLLCAWLLWQQGLSSALSLADIPGLWRSVWLSGFTGLLSTVLAALLAVYWVEVGQRFAWLVGVPHLALAVGLAQIWSPSGLWGHWSVASGLLGQVPQFPNLRDDNGLFMVFALMLKEAAFLAIVFGSQSTAEDGQRVTLARSLGCSRAQAYWRVHVPMILARGRYAIWLALTYAVTQVEVASVLSPQRPPTLALMIIERLNDARPEAWTQAIWLVLALVVLVVLTIVTFELLFKPLLAHRVLGDTLAQRCLTGFSRLAALHIVLSMVILVILAVTKRWPRGQWIPSGWHVDTLLRVLSGDVFFNTLVLGLTASLLGLLIALMLLHFGWRFAGASRIWVVAALGLPSLLTVLGLYWLSVQTQLPSILALLWGHGFVVLAYQLLLLAPAWQKLPKPLCDQAASLGMRPWQVTWRVRLPLMSRVIATALAIGFSVSVAQYVSTLVLTGGRVQTLGIEVVIAAGSGQRNYLAASALMLASLPALVFWMSHVAPNWLWRTRKGMQIDD